MLVSFTGIIILSFQGGSLFEQKSNFYGVFLALSSAFIWALYWILNMKTKIDEVLGLFLIFLFSTVYLLLGGMIRQPGLPLGREAWLSSAYIGIFEMGLSFILWLKALQLSKTTAKISNLVYFAPFINLLFVRHILGETIYISTIFGILLVVSGIIIQNLVKNKDVTS
jgi:drug/metabolite transporter (DMT)-like permease